MRVKVGNQWFEPKPGQPIAVELTDKDKSNIAAMSPHASRYGIIDDEDAKNMPELYSRAWLAG